MPKNEVLLLLSTTKSKHVLVVNLPYAKMGRSLLEVIIFSDFKGINKISRNGLLH